MDYNLDIIIPKNELKILELSEQLIEWGDNIFSYTPPKYKSKSNIFFEQVEDLGYYKEMLDETIVEEKLIALHLNGEELSNMEFIINSLDGDIYESKLLLFLMELFEVSKFYILLLREDENVKEKYIVRERAEIGKIIKNNLKWTDPKDILITK